MKNKKGISLPHPVLGLGDDIVGSFKIDLSISIKNQLLTIIENSVGFDNEYFKTLYSSKKIATAYKIKCSSTLYSYSHVNGIDISIPCTELSRTVVIDCFLIAIDDITNYSDSSFNPDSALGENKGIFIVKKGAIVGEGGSSRIELDTLFVNGLAGIIEFKPVPIDQPVSIDTDNPKIVISYPKKDGEADMINLLSQKNSRFKQTFLNLFLIPALTQAYTDLIKADSENKYENFLEQYEWASLLDSLTDDFDTADDPYELAQYFLKSIIEKKTSIAEPIPVISSFNELKEY
jgi:hypothetical protein